MVTVICNMRSGYHFYHPRAGLKRIPGQPGPVEMTVSELEAIKGDPRMEFHESMPKAAAPPVSEPVSEPEPEPEKVVPRMRRKK